MDYVASNLNKLRDNLTLIQKKNLPFSEAIALNNVAFYAKKELIEDTGKRFTLRNTRVLKGYRVIKANKKQQPIQSVVTHLDEWMAIHEAGGVKKSETGNLLGVPRAETYRKGISKKGVKKQSFYPKNLIADKTARNPRLAGKLGGRGHKSSAKPKPFLINTGKIEAIVARSPLGRKYTIEHKKKGKHWSEKNSKGKYIEKKKIPFIYYYKMLKSVRIKKRWEFKRTVEKVVKEQLPEMFIDALDKSTNSSKFK